MTLPFDTTTIGLLNKIPIPIAVLNRQGIVVAVNKCWIDFSNANNGDVYLNTSYIDVCDMANPEEYPEAPLVKEGIIGIINGTIDTFYCDYPCHSENEQRWFRVVINSYPIEQSCDNDCNVLIMHINITDKHLAIQALCYAKEEAEKINELKNMFLANMSHELRTPLNAILGFSEIMRSSLPDSVPERFKQYADVIHDSGNKLLHIIEQMFEMSKIENSTLTLNEQIIDINSIIDYCIDYYSVDIKKKNINIKCNTHNTLLLCDEKYFKQGILPLISNAIKFSHDNSTITINVDRTSSHVTIDITDNGIGMDDNTIANLGIKFFQGDATLTKKYEGTGLGIALSKFYIEFHGGCLMHSSVKGKGTCARVLMPITKLISTTL